MARADFDCEGVGCFCLKPGGLYCGCEDGSIVMLNAPPRSNSESSLSPPQTLIAPNQSKPTSITIYQTSLLVGRAGGLLESFDLTRGNTKTWELQLPCNTITNLDLGGPNLERLLASTENSVHMLQITADGQRPRNRCLFECHSGPITGAVELREAGRVCTCGVDGMLRVWDFKDGRQIAKLGGCGKSAVMAASHSADLIALGSEKGVVRIIGTGHFPSMTVVLRLRLHKAAVSSIAFNSTGSRLACTSSDKRVCFFDTTGPKVSLLGYVCMSDRVLSLSWVQFGSEDRLVMGLATGGITCAQCPKQPTTKENQYKYSVRDVPCQSIKIEFPLLKITPANLGTIPSIFALGVDRNIRRYDLPKEASGWTGAKGRMHRSTAKSEKHSKADGALSVSHAFPIVASGSADGSIAVWRNDMTGGKKVVVHQLLNGGVSSVSFDKSGRHLAAAGSDGSLVLLDISDTKTQNEQTSTPAKVQNPRFYEPRGVCDKQDVDEEHIWTEGAHRIDVVEEEAASQEVVVEQDKKDPLLLKLKALKQNFDRCVLANSRATESEQLEPFEFVMDRPLEKKLKAQGDERVAKIKEKAKREIQTLSIVWERNKQHCWDPMEVKGASVAGLKSPIEIHNFPLAKESDGDALFEKMRLLREVELKEHRSLDLQSQGATLRVDLDKDGKPIGSEKPQMDDGEATEAPTEEGEASEQPLDKLLYDDFDMIVPRRKTAQIHFIKKKIRDIKVKFNEEFQLTVSRKISELDKIEEHTTRMKEVARDLVKLGGSDGGSVGFSPKTSDLDDPETVLVVKNEEVKVEKYLSPEEQAKADEERLEEENRMQSAKKNNIFERALKQMMGGTLEKRTEVEDEFKLDMPEWMMGDPSAFNDEQIKEVKEFQARLKSLEDEKAKKRAALESELRTLRANIEDVCDKFDKHLLEVHHRFLDAQWELLQAELQIVSLGNSVHRFANVDDEKEAALMKNLTSMKERRSHLSQSLQEFRTIVAEQQDCVNSLVVEDRQMERAFKREFAETQDHYTELHELYKWRGGSPRGNPDDPNLEREVPALDIETMPEGLPPLWWDKLVEHRETKIQHERQLKGEQTNLIRMKKQLQKLEIEDQAMEFGIGEAVAEIGDFKGLRQMISYNVEYPISLKQGQVETQPEGMSSDFGHAAIVHRSIVEDLNQIIKGKGGKKVAILTAIKDFKKGIYGLQWENQGCDMKAEDLVERTRELQLLRVNKSVHQVVKQGEAGLKSHEAAGYEQLMKFNEHLHKNNVAERQKKVAKLEATIMEKAMQNEQMKEEIDKIHKLHDGHKRVEHSLATTRSPSRKVMRTIVTDKKLRDIAKAQAVEIQMLQAEMERWHMRTYPSFVDTKKYYPDEKLPI
ncbi:hypothetical protein BSKO_00240 [Bryopsis sp. KO-2023]|nr:hypothetical protein BSKO_00240 [Bryopsis sp. KO-2023]